MSKEVEELKKLGWDANAITELQEKIKNEYNTTMSRINNFLEKIGVPNQIGKDYLATAIFYCINHKISQGQIKVTAELYSIIAKKYKTKINNITTNINYTYKNMIEKRNPELEKLLGYSIQPDSLLPKYYELIFLIANYIRLGKDLE